MTIGTIATLLLLAVLVCAAGGAGAWYGLRVVRREMFAADRARQEMGSMIDALQDVTTDQAQLVLDADGVLQQLAGRLDGIDRAHGELKKAVTDLTEYLEDDSQRRENDRQQPKGFWS